MASPASEARAGTAVGAGIGFTYQPEAGSSKSQGGSGLGGKASRFLTGRAGGSSSSQRNSDASHSLPHHTRSDSTTSNSRFQLDQGYASHPASSNSSNAYYPQSQPHQPHSQATSHPQLQIQTHQRYPSNPPSASSIPANPALSPIYQGYNDSESFHRPIRQSSLASTTGSTSTGGLSSPPLTSNVHRTSTGSAGGPSISPRTTSLTSKVSPSESQTAGLAPALPIPEEGITHGVERRTSGGGSRPGTGSSRRVSWKDGGETEGSKRTPSRQLLQSALDLAQKAVEMDQGNDVVGALEAYREAVRLLKAVMHRVGADGSGKGRGGRAEEEGRTLRGIHDAYIARIQLLSTYDAASQTASTKSSSSPSTSPRVPDTSTAPQQSGITTSEAASSSTLVLSKARAASPESMDHLSAPGAADGTDIEGTTEAEVLRSGEGTPRASVDTTSVGGAGSGSEAGEGIGAFMISDQSFDPISPEKASFVDPERASQLQPPIQREPREEPQPSAPVDPSRNSTSEPYGPGNVVILDDLPPRRESLNMNGIGLGHPTSPPRATSPSQIFTQPTATPTAPLAQAPLSSPKRPARASSNASTPRRHRRQQASVGLEDEAGLTAADGLLNQDEMEEMMEQMILDNRPDRRGTGGDKDKDRDKTSHARTSSIDRALSLGTNLTLTNLLGGGEGRNSGSHSRSGSIDKTLPPLPSDFPSPVTASSHTRTSSLGRVGHLISSSTSQGTISQRRLSRPSPQIPSDTTHGDAVGSSTQNGIPSSKSMAFPSRLLSKTSSYGSDKAQGHSVVTGADDGSAAGQPGSISARSRSRSRSQPGQRPDLSAESADDVPPLPNLRNKASFPSQASQASHRSASSSIRSTSDNLAPPLSHSVSYQSQAYHYKRSGSPSSLTPTTISGSLISPVPELQPQEVLHRPFHLLRILHSSMDPDGPGAYLTGAIHIPSSIWTTTSSHSRSNTATSASTSASSANNSSAPNTGVRIQAQDTKVRIMESLLLHLEIIRHTGTLLLEGPREVHYGVPGVAAPKVGAAVIAGAGQEFLNALDGMEEECDGAHKALIKAGVVVGGWKGKKASTGAVSWGSKISRSMDKMGNPKAIDSIEKYVDLLASLCVNIQIIDNHLGNFTSSCTPAYHCVAEPGFRAIEQRLLRVTDFVRVVIVPFVLDDFKQFFHRYLKAGMRYIED